MNIVYTQERTRQQVEAESAPDDQSRICNFSWIRTWYSSSIKSTPYTDAARSHLRLGFVADRNWNLDYALSLLFVADHRNLPSWVCKSTTIKQRIKDKAQGQCCGKTKCSNYYSMFFQLINFLGNLKIRCVNIPVLIAALPFMPNRFKKSDIWFSPPIPLNLFFLKKN